MNGKTIVASALAAHGEDQLRFTMNGVSFMEVVPLTAVPGPWSPVAAGASTTQKL